MSIIKHESPIPICEIDKLGTERWIVTEDNGEFLHRDDGPALRKKNGDEHWFQYGKYHREDGPAAELANGDKYWYLNGKHIPCKSQEEFAQLIRLKAFW
jgi:hypothetical protein